MGEIEEIRGSVQSSPNMLILHLHIINYPSASMIPLLTKYYPVVQTKVDD